MKHACERALSLLTVTGIAFVRHEGLAEIPRQLGELGTKVDYNSCLLAS